MQVRAGDLTGVRVGLTIAVRIAVFRTEFDDRLLEVVDGTEGVVDAGKAQVGDFVELTQRAEDGQANLVARNFGQAARADRVLYLLGELGKGIIVDRASL